MRSNLHDMLEDHWRMLAADPITTEGRLKVSALPVTGATGPLCAAVDIHGTRHLLIPLAPNEAATSAVDTALRWRQRALEDTAAYRRYADLGCYRKDLNDIFTGLCIDILYAVETTPTKPLKSARTVVDRWRALFADAGSRLGLEQLAGLYGELLVLRMLLDHHGEASRLWTGPAGHRHDFTATARSVEVKTSTATEGRRVRIHGLDQLNAPVGGGLDLVWLRVERVAAGGQSVPGLLDELLRLSDNVHDLLSRLADVGYRSAQRDHYLDVQFRLVERRWYTVTDEFPRLTANSFPGSTPPPVTDVHYTVDLLPDPTEPLIDAVIDEHLIEMTRSLA